MNIIEIESFFVRKGESGSLIVTTLIHKHNY